MAEVRGIYRFIDQIAPFHTQESFDNAGFLVGRGGQNVKKVLVALDITPEVAEEAVQWGAELIVAHHPVIFHPVKSITDESVTGRILLALTEHKIAAICAHTNLDAAHGGVNGCLARALELSDIEQLCQAGVDDRGRPYGIGRIGAVHRSGLSAGEYAAYVKERLNSACVRFVDGGRPVRRVAVGGGACGDFFPQAAALGCDTFVTADVKYHQFVEAQAMGLSLIDAGHFPTENLICPELLAALGRRFPALELRQSSCHSEVIQYYL